MFIRQRYMDEAGTDGAAGGGKGADDGKGTGSNDAPAWVSGIKDEGIRGVAGKFTDQDAFLDAMGLKLNNEPGDWRDGLPDDLKPVAERFTSSTDAMRAIQNFQKREGQVRVPGKGASEEETKAYLKAIGVPDKVTGYEFPEIPEAELTDAIKASRAAWGERFHSLNVPKAAASKLMAFVAEDAKAEQAALLKADKDYATAQVAALKSEWKGQDYEKNMALANRAFEEVAKRSGLDLEDLRHIETKGGQFLMDNAAMIRLFAVIGREMAEGTIGPSLTEGQLETLDEQINDTRKQIEQAQAEGNSKRANKLYEREQSLIAKKGSRPIVGTAGRTL